MAEYEAFDLAFQGFFVHSHFMVISRVEPRVTTEGHKKYACRSVLIDEHKLDPMKKTSVELFRWCSVLIDEHNLCSHNSNNKLLHKAVETTP